MFCGSYNRRIDTKHRFYLPSKMKKKLVIGALYCSRDEEGVLFFQAQDLLEQVKHSLVFEVGIDKYGRVMIPYQLREGMKKNRIVCVTGDRDVFRIAQKGE